MVNPLPMIHLQSLSDWREDRPVGLICSARAWDSVQPTLHLPVVWRWEPLQATEEYWDTIFSEFRGEVVYAVGGGITVDAAKYLAAQRSLPLVCIPTALSVDAFFSGVSSVRKDCCSNFVKTVVPDELVVDLHVIACAPAHIRSAGISCLAGIPTACWDWHYAELEGQNPLEHAYLPFVAQAALALWQGAQDCAEAAGRGDPDGLKQLLDCLALEVQLCNQLGHNRIKVGSAQYFASVLESLVGYGYSMGELVGPGILLMAEYQVQDNLPMKRALEANHVPLDRFSPHTIQTALHILPDYARRNALPFGIAHKIAFPS